jgi:hypothetical protein
MLVVDDLAMRGAVDSYSISAHGFLQPAHNAYLTVWAELGLPGLLLFSLICWTMIRRFRRASRVEATVMGACWLAISIVMLFEFHFWLDAHWRVALLWVIGLCWGYVSDPAAPVIIAPHNPPSADKTGRVVPEPFANKSPFP